MKRLTTALSIAASIAMAGAATLAGAQTFPAPENEAALYEAAKKEGTVTWYAGFPQNIIESMMGEFTKKYPGIEIEPIRLVSVQQFQRFVQESKAGQGITDLLYLDTWSIDALAEEGYIAEWVPPNAKLLPESARVGNFAYNQAYATVAIAYNSNNVTPEEVEKLKSWRGILDPVFKDRVALSPQLCSTCYTPVHFWMAPENEEEYGEKFMHELAAMKPHIYAEINLAIDRVAAGEEDIVYCCLWGALANARYVKGAPIRWVFPTPTPVAPEGFMAINALAPHPNAARLFLNWWISADGLAAQQKFFGDGSAMKGVPDDMAATSESWYESPTETYTLDRVRWNKDFGDDMALWAKILEEEGH